MKSTPSLSLFWTLLAVTILGPLGAGTANATTPPQPGGRFPEEYLNYRKAHPDKFKVTGGWKNKVERARSVRDRKNGQGAAGAPGATGGGPATAAAIAAAGGVVTGNFRIPVVLVQYANTATPPYANTVLQDVLFGTNPTGNLTAYYSEVSYGNITVTGDAFNWVQVGQNDTHYEGTSNGLVPATSRTGELLRDSLDLLDGGVDFGQFDNDGPDGTPNSGDDDGVVDFVAFVQPENGGECAPGNTNIWSHRWRYRFWPNAGGNAYTTGDARHGGGSILIDDYVIQPARNCAGGTIEIGVFAHEFGHAFGIPDLYDTDNSSNGLGSWSLMASGNWRTPARPAHWDAWSKTHVGWIVPDLLTSQHTGYVLPQVETNARAARISIGNGRYYLIENRQSVGFDNQIASCGLVIYDIDESVIAARSNSNTVNTQENCGTFQASAPNHYGIALKQADGSCHLEGRTNRADAGDAFPGSSGNRTFDGTSNPSVIDYLGNDPQVSVRNISNCGATMTADIRAFPLPDPPVTALDVAFVIDLSGSYADDLPLMKAQIQDIVDRLAAAFPDLRLGLASFRDFPFPPFGGGSDFAYQIVSSLASDRAAFVAAFNGLSASGGSDLPESQYEALYQVLTGAGRDLNGDGDTADPGEIAPSNIGWASGRTRVVYLLTDASFHDSDTENYPGTLLEAAGRADVRALLQPGNPLLFTLISEHPSVVVTSGQDGVPPLSKSTLVLQADELANASGGGVLSAGLNSSALATAVTATISQIKVSAPPTRIAIDVKPGNAQNNVNPNTQGVLPVALLGSAALPVARLRPMTLRFGPSGTLPAHDLDNSQVLAERTRDVNGDGLLDLLVHFSIPGSGITRGLTEVCMIGELDDGKFVVGCDAITTK